MNLALFLGLWGNLDPLKAKKSSSFSLLVKAITNFGGQTGGGGGGGGSPLPPEDDLPPFLLSEEAAGLLLWLWFTWLLLLWWWWWWLLLLLSSCAPLSGEAILLKPPPLLWPPLMTLEFSEFLLKLTTQAWNKQHQTNKIRPYATRLTRKYNKSNTSEVFLCKVVKKKKIWSG